MPQYQKVLYNDPLKFGDSGVLNYKDLSKTQQLGIRVLMRDENENGRFDKQNKYIEDGGLDLSIIDNNGSMSIIKPLTSLQLKHIERELQNDPTIFIGKDPKQIEALGLNPDLTNEEMRNNYYADDIVGKKNIFRFWKR